MSQSSVPAELQGRIEFLATLLGIDEREVVTRAIMRYDRLACARLEGAKVCVINRNQRIEEEIEP